MKWYREVVRRVAHGEHPLCQLGHQSHPVEMVDIDLSQSRRFIPDIPVAGNLQFKIAAFLEMEEDPRPGYCLGRGAVSSSLRHQGIWEGFDTLLHCTILKTPDPGIFMDFGSNVGWYSITAALLGRDVIGFEADRELAKAMDDGFHANKLDPPRIVKGWIDSDTPELPLLNAPHIRLIKSDVEGAEQHVLRILQPLFAADVIDYMMLELSPMFGGWETTVSLLNSLDNYQLSIVPDKGYPIANFQRDPLGCSLAHMQNPDLNALTTQETGLLVRKDLL